MAITFRVNLDTVAELSNFQPYNRTEGTNFPLTRSTWFPNLILNNRELKDGDEFEVSGMQALYLRNNFTSGVYKFLDEVSGSP